MFCPSFEKIAVSTGLIQGALKGRIAGAVAQGGKSAGAGVIRSFEAKSANLGSKGMIESSGQRGAALSGMLPKPEKPSGGTLDYSKFKGGAKPMPQQKPVPQINPTAPQKGQYSSSFKTDQKPHITFKNQPYHSL